MFGGEFPPPVDRTLTTCNWCAITACKLNVLSILLLQLNTDHGAYVTITMYTGGVGRNELGPVIQYFVATCIM